MLVRKRSHELDEAEANRSDPEDTDYQDRPSPSKKTKRPTKKPKSKSSRKRTDRGYKGSDIESEDDFGSESVAHGVSDSSGPLEVSETGRPKRKASTKAKTLKEPSDEESEEEGIEEVSDASSPPLHPHTDPASPSASPSNPTAASNPPQPSLIVKLKVNVPRDLETMDLRRRSSRTASAGKSIPPQPATGVRRSSRVSHDDQEPLLSLTDSGRHARVAREGSEDHGQAASRQTRSRKQVAPSAPPIIEASQEDSEHGDQDQEMGEAAEEAPAAGARSADDGDAPPNTQQSGDAEMGQGGIVAESVQHDDDEDDDDHDDDDDEDEDEPVVTTTRRTTRLQQEAESEPKPARGQLRSRAGKKRKTGEQESSDFDPEADDEPEDDHMSGSEESPKKASQQSRDSSGGRRSSRIAKRRKNSNQSGSGSLDSDGLDLDELADEAADLRPRRRRQQRREDIIFEERPKRRSRAAQVDYRVFKPELLQAQDEDDAPTQSAFRNRGRSGLHRSLFSTLGPFGGAGGPTPVFAGPEGTGAAAGADSDSSDEETPQQKTTKGIGGAVGMTPTSAMPQGLMPQALNQDAAQGVSGGPANFGKVKDKKALADVDPLGVDPNVDFEGVGGLDSHINQLKEMVALPLLYPEVFQRFKVTPPRGVLFHGPPGTGKTLLARALASSVSSQGRKVTFYMRKGADALSKWVGEAERQLRLLFEEARKNQPSIIFFDEIDGLAPVRSSKQEQIHSSIVATLLALMDGMDGRGQVIVIGATNRPDTVDPALRRPGRFDREFYFPLPNQVARRAIIDIHTKGWNPPLSEKFKDHIAELTKGYGGADLRALCTEAALNAVQGTYPQIYKSNEKLVIDPTKIQIQPKDFMISINKIIPSSERSGSSSAAPLDSTVEPLLRRSLDKISAILDEVMPDRPRRTALEEAEYDDRDDEQGFDREVLQQKFDKSRTYRPRLLIQGIQGMGQQYLGGALLHKFERLHVQPFDLSALYSNPESSPEATVVQLFNEVKRHKPCVIYIPNVNTWYETVGPSVLRLFCGLLRSLPPNEPVLVLGIMELENASEKPCDEMLKDLFGFSSKNQYVLQRPGEPERKQYFDKIMSMISTKPDELPNPETRKRRQIPELEVAPPPKEQKGPTKSDLKALKKQDMKTLNMLKILIQHIMDHIKNKYKKFRHPVVEESRISYLFDEQTPGLVTTDLPEEQRGHSEHERPFELREDTKGVPGLYEIDTGKFYYNLEITTIEKRLSNGYYKRFKDFVADIKRLAKDAKTSGEEERILKANELLSNVEVDIQLLEDNNPALVAASEAVYEREQERAKQAHPQRQNDDNIPHLPNVPPRATGSTTQSTGPIQLGEALPGRDPVPFATPARPEYSQLTNGDSSQHQVNGFHAAHDDLGDVPMGNTPEAQHASAANTQQRSQRSALTTMAQNSQPGDYHNSASTTSSGNKTSDKSKSDPNRSSGPYAAGGVNSQSTNGVGGGGAHDHPDFFALRDMSGQSQIPDTQEMLGSGAASSQSHSQPQSQPQSQPPSQPSSQPLPMAPPPPTRQPTSLTAILNNTSAAPQDEQQQHAHPQFLLDLRNLAHLHENMVQKSSGCSVEQLEQINAVLMDAIWRQRGEWNRNKVAKCVKDAFNAIVEDIERCQKIAPNSQESQGVESSSKGTSGGGSGRGSSPGDGVGAYRRYLSVRGD